MSARPKKQIGALPWRKKKGLVQILLVTSRETKRWVIPKGWPMDNRADYNAARREAFEEAGVKGHIHRTPFGKFDYIKTHADGDFPCRVIVYALEVTEQLKSWPEKRERQREWFDGQVASELVAESQLKALILAFARAQDG